MADLTSNLILKLLDQVTAPARGINRALEGLRGAATQNAQRMNELRGQMVDAVAVGYSLARSIAAPVRAAADFETAMNQVRVLSGATGDQMDALSQQARELGRTTQFTASQAGDAMGFLAMAGFDATQIIGAMPGTLQLAAAAQMDLGRTADIVSNILSGYGMQVEELGRVNDVLVKAFTTANMDLSQLGESMKYAGPIASAAGLRFEEVAAAVGILADAGIQGSMAGTSLTGAIRGVLNPSAGAARTMQRLGLQFTDTQGRMLPLVDIVRQLEPHAEDAGLMMELFGQRAGPAMAALVGKGADALAELDDKLVNSAGTAQAVADVQMQGFNGQMKALSSAIEGFQIAVGNALIPGLTAMVEGITRVIAPITELAERYPMATQVIVAATSAIIAFRVAAIAAAYAGTFMKGALLSMAIPAVSATAGILGLLNPLKLVTNAMRILKVALIGTGIGAALVAIGAAGALIYQNWEGITIAFEAFGGAFMRAIEPVMPAIDPVIAGFGSLVGWVSSLIGPLDEGGALWAQWGIAAGKALGAFVVGTVEAIAGFVTFVQEIPARASAFAAAVGQAFDDAVDATMQAVDRIVETAGRIIDESIAAVTSLASEMIAAGTALVQGLWDGMVTAFAEFDWAEFGIMIGQGILSGIQAIGGKIRDLFLSLIPDPRSWFGWGGGGSSSPALDGARADGGPVSAGGSYLVGEEGPEIFTPGASGFVSPNEVYRQVAAAGDSGGGSRAPAPAATATMGSIVVNVYAQTSASAREIGDEVRRAIEGVYADALA